MALPPLHRLATVLPGMVALALLPMLAACSGLSGDAQAVADACRNLPGATAESCGCYAREVQGKLSADQMRIARYAQTEPARLLDPKVLGNLSANDVVAVTRASAAALKTCKIVS